MNSLTSESIPYTCAVLNETLRLLSPIGANVRKWTIHNNRIKIFLQIHVPRQSQTEMSFEQSCNTSQEYRAWNIWNKDEKWIQCGNSVWPLACPSRNGTRSYFITGNFYFLKKNSEIFERILGLKCSRVLPRKMVWKWIVIKGMVLSAVWWRPKKLCWLETRAYGD